LLVATCLASQCDFDDATVCASCLVSDESCETAVWSYCDANNWNVTGCTNHVTLCPFHEFSTGAPSPCTLSACTDAVSDTECESAIEAYCVHHLVQQRLDSDHYFDSACSSFRGATCMYAGEVEDCSNACGNTTKLLDGECDSRWDCSRHSNDGGDCATAPSLSEEDKTTRVVSKLSLRGSGLTAATFNQNIRRSFRRGVARRASSSVFNVPLEDVIITAVTDLSKKQATTGVNVDFYIRSSSAGASTVVSQIQDTSALVSDINTSFNIDDVDATVTSTELVAVSIEHTNESSSDSDNTGAIAGGVVGGLAGAAIIAGALYCYRKRQSDAAPEKPVSRAETVLETSKPIAMFPAEDVKSADNQML